MARIIPQDFKAPSQIGLYESERQTLEHLADALPDSYTVFSNVLWARAHSRNTRFGEIDFVVVSPAGQLIVIEQKSGGLTVRNGEIYKHYGSVEKNAGEQLLRSIAAMKNVWQKQHQGQTIAIDYLLYLPDYKLRNLTGLQLDAERIVHADSHRSLAQTIEHICDNDPEDKEKVSAQHDFLTGILELELDIGKLQSNQERLYRRHEDSLLAWVNRIKFTPYILRINGCAGSGKTQVAVGLLREALNRDEKARYICFNRPLADSLGKALNLTDHIHTRDQFYDKFLKSQEAIFDYDDKDANIYEQLEALVERSAIPDEWLVDLLIIDEGQDIPERSLTTLRRFLKPNGRLVWLEDPEQNLYGHEPVVLPGAVELVLEQCFRSPQTTLSYLKMLFPVNRELVSANPFVGEPPEFHVAEPETLPEILESRVNALLAKGVSLADIAVVSLGSVRRSALDRTTSIGPYALSTFTGEYSAEGEQIWTKGDLMFDSIFRFKGSQRPFVLLVDVDAESIDTKIVRRLYCGMTRATVGVELFMTPQFEAALRKVIPS
jgi:hypothetical protein